MLCVLHKLAKVWVRVPALPLDMQKRLRLLVLAAFGATSLLILTPRMHDSPARPREVVFMFDEEDFRGHFKFRKGDLYTVLEAMRLTEPNSARSPCWLHIGPPGAQSLVPSDWALCVLLKRLATGGSYRDVLTLLGGSKTILCATFLHMLELLHEKYGGRLRDLKFFRDKIPDFVRLVNNLCNELHGIDSPFDNLIALIDGHLMGTARPGGEGCVRPNMYDTDVFNGKDRMHGLKYQVRDVVCVVCVEC